MNSAYVNEYKPGFWELVKEVDQNPRPESHEGLWSNGLTTFHYIGQHSGIIAIKQHQIGGFDKWFSPEMGEIDEPNFKRVDLDRFLDDPRVTHIEI